MHVISVTHAQWEVILQIWNSCYELIWSFVDEDAARELDEAGLISIWEEPFEDEYWWSAILSQEVVEAILAWESSE